MAAFWWRYGTERSTMIGDTSTGYIVTPYSDGTGLALSEIFRDRMNMEGNAVRRRLRGNPQCRPCC